jgi:hypothetical protein
MLFRREKIAGKTIKLKVLEYIARLHKHRTIVE